MVLFEPAWDSLTEWNFTAIMGKRRKCSLLLPRAFKERNLHVCKINNPDSHLYGVSIKELIALYHHTHISKVQNRGIMNSRDIAQNVIIQ